MTMPNAVAIVSTRLEFRKQSTGVTDAPPESPVVLLEMSDLQACQLGAYLFRRRRLVALAGLYMPRAR